MNTARRRARCTNCGWTADQHPWLDGPEGCDQFVAPDDVDKIR